MAIIGVLVMLILPKYGSYVARSRRAEAKVNLGQISSLQSVYSVENYGYKSLPLAGYKGTCDFSDGTPLAALGFTPDDCNHMRYGYEVSAGARTFTATAFGPSDADGRWVYPKCSGAGASECGESSGDKLRVTHDKHAEVCRSIVKYCPESTGPTTPTTTPTPTPCTDPDTDWGACVDTGGGIFKQERRVACTIEIQTCCPRTTHCCDGGSNMIERHLGCADELNTSCDCKIRSCDDKCIPDTANQTLENCSDSDWVDQEDPNDVCDTNTYERKKPNCVEVTPYKRPDNPCPELTSCPAPERTPKPESTTAPGKKKCADPIPTTCTCHPRHKDKLCIDCGQLNSPSEDKLPKENDCFCDAPTVADKDGDGNITPKEIYNQAGSLCNDTKPISIGMYECPQHPGSPSRSEHSNKTKGHHHNYPNSTCYVPGTPSCHNHNMSYPTSTGQHSHGGAGKYKKLTPLPSSSSRPHCVWIALLKECRCQFDFKREADDYSSITGRTNVCR